MILDVSTKDDVPYEVEVEVHFCRNYLSKLVRTSITELPVLTSNFKSTNLHDKKYK